MVDFYRMRQLMRFEPKIRSERNDIIQSAALKGVQYSDMPKAAGYNTDKMDNAIIKLEEVENAYSQIVKELKEQRTELRPMIDQLPNPHQRAVMRLRYMDGYSPETIANDCRVPLSVSSVYNYLHTSEHIINVKQGWVQNG